MDYSSAVLTVGAGVVIFTILGLIIHLQDSLTDAQNALMREMRSGEEPEEELIWRIVFESQDPGIRKMLTSRILTWWSIGTIDGITLSKPGRYTGHNIVHHILIELEHEGRIVRRSECRTLYSMRKEIPQKNNQDEVTVMKDDTVILVRKI